MKIIDYSILWQKALIPDTVILLTQIHEFKVKGNIINNYERESLNQLIEKSKIDSIEASNRIDDINTSKDRIVALVKDKIVPKTQNEFEMAGYRDVINSIHSNYRYIPINSNVIAQLHKDLYKYQSVDGAGKFNSDSFIELCDVYSKIEGNLKIDLLIVIPMFILDFLCIRPFQDGNERMSRLLLLLMLYRAGYDIGKYISIESFIEQNKEGYNKSLKESSERWDESENNYIPFIKYILEIIVDAYKEFDNKLEEIDKTKYSKPKRIEKLIKDTNDEITKTDIMNKYKDISQITIQRTLAELLELNKIIKIHGGRYTKYVWNREKE